MRILSPAERARCGQICAAAAQAPNPVGSFVFLAAAINSPAFVDGSKFDFDRQDEVGLIDSAIHISLTMPVHEIINKTLTIHRRAREDQVIS